MWWKALKEPEEISRKRQTLEEINRNVHELKCIHYSNKKLIMVKRLFILIAVFCMQNKFNTVSVSWAEKSFHLHFINFNEFCIGKIEMFMKGFLGLQGEEQHKRDFLIRSVQIYIIYW